MRFDKCDIAMASNGNIEGGILLITDVIDHKMLTLPFPSLLVPTPFTKGGGGVEPTPSYLKTVTLIDLKFCRVLETPLKVLEMLKLFI